MREAAQRTYIPAVPATYYDLMSFKQKATLSNYFVTDGAWVALTLKPPIHDTMEYYSGALHCQWEVGQVAPRVTPLL